MKFSPVLALYVAAAVVGYMIYENLFGVGGAVKKVWDDSWEGAGNTVLGASQSLTLSGLSPRIEYNTARSAWFRDHGLSGSAATDRASESDFPTPSTWVGNGGTVDFPDE